MALRVFVATILFGWLSLGTAYEQQIILSSNTHEAISSGLHSGNASHIVNMTVGREAQELAAGRQDARSSTDNRYSLTTSICTRSATKLCTTPNSWNSSVSK